MREFFGARKFIAGTVFLPLVVDCELEARYRFFRQREPRSPRLSSGSNLEIRFLLFSLLFSSFSILLLLFFSRLRRLYSHSSSLPRDRSSTVNVLADVLVLGKTPAGCELFLSFFNLGAYRNLELFCV